MSNDLDNTIKRAMEQYMPQVQKKCVKTALFDEKKFRETLPPEMLAEKRWMRYFLQPKAGGGTAKIPLGNHADASTWSYFDDAVAALETGKEQGLGYAFYEGELQGLDIDHCRNPKTGQICNEAMLLLERIPSWAEYSVSGQGIHVLFKGNVRGKQLGEQCLQFWNSKNSPRFFALTCEMVGDAFKALKDVGEEFNYVFATARHISAKIREELKAIDPEQFASLPAEREVAEPVSREKSKTKSRKVASGFDIKDFLAFYGLQIDNETDNELGHCIRLTTCPLKGEAHVGQNGTTTNFIYPAKDGGLAFHCQSTGCVEYGIGEVIKQLAERSGPYPKPIYEAKVGYKVEILSHRASTIKSETWEWVVIGYLPKGAEVHLFAGKGRGKTKVCNYFNKLANDQGMRVVRFNMEDHEASILKPTLHAAGCNLELTEVVDRAALASLDGHQMSTSIDFSKPEFVAALEELVTKFGDVGLVIIEPINNYKGKSKAISEDDMRPIHTALATLAEKLKICVLTVSHTNRKKDVDIQEKSHGAGSGINVARVNLYLDKDLDGDADERILADAGSNIKVGKSIVFKIVEQPPFELDGVTHKEIAIAIFDRETDTTGQDLLERGESPAKQSQSKDIGAWMVEYLTGKGEVRKDVVLGAGKQFNKDWSEDNLTKVFNRRLKKTSKSRTEGGGKNKVTFWSLGKKEQTAMVFDSGRVTAAVDGVAA
jgi:nitroreductase